MKSKNSVSAQTRATLAAIYREVMWLARRKGVSASAARAWYTHIRSNTVRQSIRRFTGKISEKASRSKGMPLRLEHYKRIQTTLTKLIQKHLRSKINGEREFIRIVLSYECVHIVTSKENYDVMRAKGSYRKAGIELRAWRSLPPPRRALLWKTMLRGKVANAQTFAPKQTAK
jgi:hypothetical protein